MMGLVNFSLLAVLTIFAAAAAAALCWMSLRITILVIEPARARRVPCSTKLADGRGRLARSRPIALPRNRD